MSRARRNWKVEEGWVLQMTLCWNFLFTPPGPIQRPLFTRLYLESWFSIWILWVPGEWERGWVWDPRTPYSHFIQAALHVSMLETWSESWSDIYGWCKYDWARCILVRGHGGFWGSVLILSQEVLWQSQKDPAPGNGGESSPICTQGWDSTCPLKDVQFLSFHKRMGTFCNYLKRESVQHQINTYLGRWPRLVSLCPGELLPLMGKYVHCSCFCSRHCDLLVPALQAAGCACRATPEGKRSLSTFWVWEARRC